MTDLRKAEKRVLELLEIVQGDLREAKEALRQALAQPEQEPVAWIKARELELMRGFIGTAQRDWRTNLGLEKWDDEDIPLYTQPVDTVNISQEPVDETAKGEQEPVAWIMEMPPPSGADRSVRMTSCKEVAQDWENAIPLYTAPPKQPKQEPVAFGFQNTAITESNRWMLLRETIPADDQYQGALWTPLYTAPPKREWVGLTGLEQKELMAMNSRYAVFETEAKLKEKNT